MQSIAYEVVVPSGCSVSRLIIISQVMLYGLQEVFRFTLNSGFNSTSDRKADNFAEELSFDS